MKGQTWNHCPTTLTISSLRSRLWPDPRRARMVDRFISMASAVDECLRYLQFVKYESMQILFLLNTIVPDQAELKY